MRRSIGVTLSAIASILGSVLLLLMVLLVTVSALLLPNDPAMTSQTRVAALIGGAVLFLFSAWGIATAVGLFRLCAWARWSMLAFSVLLTFIGAATALCLLFVPLPRTPGVPPAFGRAILAGIAGFYALLALIGGFWLYYFNTAGVKTQFSGAGPAQPPGGRPFSVTMIAWLMVSGGAMCAILAFLPLPAVLGGWIVPGWAARFTYAGIALIELWLGWGLLRLRPLSRVLSIAFFVLGAVNSLLFAFLPGADARIAASLAVFSPGLQYSSGTQFPSLIGSIATVPFSAVVIWFLVKCRPAFHPAPEIAAPSPQPPPEA
ncbi:MAG: hypothetical protein ABSC08_07320 [Bryobacteraceae bacterium]